MATFNSTKVASTVQSRAGLDECSVVGEIAIPTGFATADVLNMVKVPAGATILDLTLTSSAAVGATANLSVGDSGSSARFISSTAYTASTLTRLNTHIGHGYRYTDETMISVTGVSIATPTVGTVLRLSVRYTMQS